ncbi:hypothetical protein TYRP_023161 [Tyrophagus putrescentiae]|nr:hypothetical protein TYRP_023161 [Tyrophagus putrescentiae]
MESPQKIARVLRKRPHPQTPKQLAEEVKSSISKKKAAAKEPKTKAKAKAAAPAPVSDKPVSNVDVDMLEDVLKGISNLEFKADKLNNNDIFNDLDELLRQGSKLTERATKILNKPPLEREKKPRSTCVKLDVFKLIAEKLLPLQAPGHDQQPMLLDRDFQLSKDFDLFKKWVLPCNSDVTDLTLLNSFRDFPVRRLQVKYVRLLMNYIENVSPEAECEQFCLAEELLSFASKFELSGDSGSSAHHFSPDDLFPPFYYAVQRLIKVYSNWNELTWLFDESPAAASAAFQDDDDDDYDDDDEGDWDGMYEVETQAARLRRRVEDVWDRLLTISLQLLQRSKLSPSSEVLPFSCSTGTAFLLVVLVARNWYNLLFFNRLEPEPLKDGAAAATASKCWNLVGEFGRTLCHLYEDKEVSPAEELLKLFYPFLLYSHQVGEEEQNTKYDQPLLLSYDEVDSLIGQLVAMTPVGPLNQLQCAHFQLAFTWAYYDLVWEQLAKQQLSADDCARLLAPYQSLTTTTTERHFSWKKVFEMLLHAKSIPYTVKKSKDGGQQELKWYETRLVHKVVITLGTIAHKYLIAECTCPSGSNAAEFKYLSKIVTHFENFVSATMLKSCAIIQSIRSMIDVMRFLVGHSSFESRREDDTRQSISALKEISYGVFSSVQHCSAGLQLILDRSCTNFMKPLPIDHCIRVFMRDIGSQRWSDCAPVELLRPVAGVQALADELHSPDEPRPVAVGQVLPNVAQLPERQSR